MVGLGNVDNTSDVNKPISTATQTALNLLAPLASPTFTGIVAGIIKSMVGLGSVDNTSDVNKPISNATQAALNLLAPLASPTFTGSIIAGTSIAAGTSITAGTNVQTPTLIATSPISITAFGDIKYNTTTSLTAQMATLQFPVHLSLGGNVVVYNSSGTILSGALTTYSYFQLTTQSALSKNWTPSYTNGARLTIPYTGLYYCSFTFHTGTASTNTHIFIVKNGMGASELAGGSNGNPICMTNTGGYYAACASATVFLTTTDTITFGCYPYTGSPVVGNQCAGQITLIQRTA